MGHLYLRIQSYMNTLVLYVCPSLLFSTSQCKQFYVKFLIFGEKCLFPLLSMQRLLQFLMLQWLASLLKSDAQIRAQAFQGQNNHLNLKELKFAQGGNPDNSSLFQPVSLLQVNPCARSTHNP
jgi:hypothetical protein